MFIPCHLSVVTGSATNVATVDWLGSWRVHQGDYRINFAAEEYSPRGPLRPAESHSHVQRSNGSALELGGGSEPAPEAAQPFGARPEGRLVDLTELAVHGILLINTVIVSSNDAELPFAAKRPSLVHFASPEPFPTTLARMSLLPPGTGLEVDSYC